ncbi:MAG TPA: hypothetical protein VK986_23080, partial [Tepidisphaeraceae bacterium]|nr:hypothetical protein [Tepidisphaeraceae bacterium]
TIAVDRLGVVKLMTAVREGSKVTTEIGMKYGRTRYDLEAAGDTEHAASIKSPSSTLAIRGTRVSLTDMRPFPPEAVSLTGRADFKDQRKQVSVGGKNAGKARVTGNQASPAATELASTFLDPTISLARTDTEAKLVDTLLSRGSTITLDRESGIKVVRGGRPPTDAQLVPALPGVLNFVARWPSNSDLNLSVGVPGGKNGAGEFLYPGAGLDTTASGGKMAFDHRGGPNGGIEIAYFPANYPKGLYGLGLVLVSGEPTIAQVDAFLGGKRIGIYDGQGLRDSVAVPVFPLTPGLGEGNLAGIVPVGTSLPTSARPAASLQPLTLQGFTGGGAMGPAVGGGLKTLPSTKRDRK